VPAGLSSITKLKGKGGLLEALRPASENAASLPPADAVIALNQLKRLRPSSLSSAPPAELIDQMDSFVLAVTVRPGPSQFALAAVAFDVLFPPGATAGLCKGRRVPVSAFNQHFHPYPKP
jgi:hypothetical protein